MEGDHYSNYYSTFKYRQIQVGFINFYLVSIKLGNEALAEKLSAMHSDFSIQDYLNKCVIFEVFFHTFEKYFSLHLLVN